MALSPKGVSLMLLYLEIGLMVILILGYIAINFVVDLPRFLIGENLILAVAYIFILYLILTGNNRIGQPLLLFVSAFNAGRVSRSVITPEGEAGELAIEHIPLLVLILLISIIALYLTMSGGVRA
jgi:hypothetical protein